jgi:hypothetical protein
MGVCHFSVVDPGQIGAISGHHTEEGPDRGDQLITIHILLA